MMHNNKSECDWVCYLIESENFHTYIGSSNNAEKRLRTHNLGKGAKRTRGQSWSHVLIVSGFKSKNECLSFESGWKKLAKRRNRERFCKLDDKSSIDLKYTDYQSWNRLLDLLYFFHAFEHHDTKFVMRKGVIGKSKPDELEIKPFGTIKQLNIINDIPWPRFIDIKN